MLPLLALALAPARARPSSVELEIFEPRVVAAAGLREGLSQEREVRVTDPGDPRGGGVSFAESRRENRTSQVLDAQYSFNMGTRKVMPQWYVTLLPPKFPSGSVYELSPNLRANVESLEARNADWDKVIVDKNECMACAQALPNPEHRALIEDMLRTSSSLSPSDYSAAETSDGCRACVLFKYGGLYTDLDMDVTESFSAIVEPEDTFVGAWSVDDKDMQGTLLAARAGSPIMERYLDELVRKKQQRQASLTEAEAQQPSLKKLGLGSPHLKEKGAAVTVLAGDGPNALSVDAVMSRMGLSLLESEKLDVNSTAQILEYADLRAKNKWTLEALYDAYKGFFEDCGAHPEMGGTGSTGARPNTFEACGEQARLYQELLMSSDQAQRDLNPSVLYFAKRRDGRDDEKAPLWVKYGLFSLDGEESIGYTRIANCHTLGCDQK